MNQQELEQTQEKQVAQVGDIVRVTFVGRITKVERLTDGVLRYDVDAETSEYYHRTNRAQINGDCIITEVPHERS